MFRLVLLSLLFPVCYTPVLTTVRLRPPPLRDLYTFKQLQQYSSTRVLGPHWRGARDGPTAFASLLVLPPILILLTVAMETPQ